MAEIHPDDVPRYSKRDIRDHSAAKTELFDLLREKARDALIPVQLTYGMAHTIKQVPGIYQVLAMVDGPVAVLGDDKVGDRDITAVCGYFGFTKSVDDLRERGFKGEMVPIKGAVIGDRAPNTLTESVALAKHVATERAAGKTITHVRVVGPEIQNPRFALTVHHAFKLHCPEVIVVPQVGAHQDLDEPVVHSQGVLQGLRGEMFFYEGTRVEAYGLGQGNMSDPREALPYFKKVFGVS